MDHKLTQGMAYFIVKCKHETQGSEMTATIVALPDPSAQYLQYLSALHR